MSWLTPSLALESNSGFLNKNQNKCIVSKKPNFKGTVRKENCLTTQKEEGLI